MELLAHEFVHVKDFMSRNVKTVYFDSNVSKAVNIMVENNIGSVVVVDSEGPVGIFTERDLLSKVLVLGRQLEYQMIIEAMSQPFVEIQENQTLLEASKSMIKNRNRLMVFEDQDLKGIVTATDIVREIAKTEKSFDISRFVTRKVDTVHSNMDVSLVIEEMDEKGIGSVIVGHNDEPPGIFTERDLLRKVLALGMSLETPVGGLATRPLITAHPATDGAEAARIMTAQNIKRLPIMDQGKLTGIVTARDLVEGFESTH